MIDEAMVRAGLPWGRMIAGLEDMLGRDPEVPARAVHALDSDAALLLMPAWIPGDLIGVKMVTFFPKNGAGGLPTIAAVYAAFDGRTGAFLAMIDGEELTARRTAAVSAVAAKRLARPDASRLVVIGTGRLSANMAAAHAEIRPLTRIAVWGRSAVKAEVLVGALVEQGLPARVCNDLPEAVAEADIVSCVTSATAPILSGAWLKPGAHVDLVGSFRADMREADDETVRRASIFVDQRSGALLSGDLAQPLAAGVIGPEAIAADLKDLVRGAHPGRVSQAEITLFKSAGDALADLAAARALLAPDG